MIELGIIYEDQVSISFLQGMICRMDMSFTKYGDVMEAKGKVDEVACLEQRIAKYKETGNTEWLIDAANFCMIEYMHRGADACRPTSSEESPGLVHKADAASGHTSDAYASGLHDEFYKDKHE